MTALTASTTRRVATAVALAAGATLVLSACGAGQVSQTATQVAAVNGNPASGGDIALRNVHVVYPNSEEYSIEPGGTAALAFTAVNLSESKEDRLTGIRTDFAGSVTISELEGGAVIAPQTALGAGVPAVTVPENAPESTSLIEVKLNDIREGVRPGLTFPVTFTFKNAGDIVVQVPVDAGPATERHESEKSPDVAEGH
ncbi:copper chaperone PCu(A)C [Rhodococcus sp. ABRD24]|uniref:copper chaperone PCu(A)C n=1 Tax=Rhodococcus sp. ABRD24 TaxID=2507582 RepID=UPI00103DCC79|nr:copper chaperone PCu(A)C [Rhodococcus sp. ABRD24]QBJ97078.1 copper chaperone PCu(A)C [Rhodococcus sp. ABRD24]